MAGERKTPSTLGEWDIEIAERSQADLLNYQEALRTLRDEWEAFNGAFKWTRMFVLIDSIQFELDRRARGRAQEPLPEVTR
jgi:hypothetical protein